MTSVRGLRAFRAERSPSRRPRWGAVTLELILGFPVLLIATVAVLEFGIALLVQQAITAAAIEGAREAAKGSTAAEVAEAVDRILSVHSIAGATAGTPDVRVDVENASGLATVGDATIPCMPNGPSSLNPNEVRVTVCVRMTDGDRPVPDWLSYFGFSLSGKTFETSAMALQE
jgi:Flp pilus assembly protein TadG